jgi:hypothetical protein
VDDEEREGTMEVVASARGGAALGRHVSGRRRSEGGRGRTGNSVLLPAAAAPKWRRSPPSARELRLRRWRAADSEGGRGWPDGESDFLC